MARERGELVILGMLEEASRGDQIRDEKRKARDLRINRGEEFLKTAESLIEKFGTEMERVDGKRFWQTPSVEVFDGARTVHICLAKYVTFGTNISSKCFAIVADTHDQRLFCIEQYFVPSLRKPQRGMFIYHLVFVATDKEIMKGLQAIKFIEKKLNSR